MGRLPTPTPLIAVLGLLAVSGCTGELSTGEPPRRTEDAGPGPADGGPDGGGGRDAGRSDAGPGEDAGGPGPVDAGPGEDAGGPPPGPCDGVSCGANERCDPTTGDCLCSAGFTREGGACVAIEPGDPAGRTVDEVCTRWNEGHVANASPAWIPGDTTCDPGTLTAEGIQDTLRRLNMFRWLVGLPPVTDDPSRQDPYQQCALMMDVNGDIDHEPPATWDCYTEAGAGAAGSSNLALGTRQPGDAIDLYMREPRTPSLGHRRWVLNFSLGQVTIGHAGSAQCLGVFDTSGSSDRDWAAYPPPGPAPTFTAQYTWHFQARFSLGDATVTVVRDSDGMELPVSSYFPRSGFTRPPSIAWNPDGWTPSPGETYRVTIGGLADGPLSYEVQVVDC